MGCDSLALVSIVPDCAAITQNFMTARGAEGEDHLCLVSSPRGWVHRSSQSFLEALSVFVCGCMPACTHVWMYAEAAASESDTVMCLLVSPVHTGDISIPRCSGWSDANGGYQLRSCMPGVLGGWARLRMYLQVGSRSLAARILLLGPCTCGKWEESKQSIALGRIFRTWCALCKTMLRARRDPTCHFEMLPSAVYVYVCIEVSPAEDE